MSKGAKLGCNSKNYIRLDYPDGSQIVFDHRIKTRDGWVAGVDIVPLTNETAKLGEDKEKKTKVAKSINVNKLHQALRHPSKKTTRATGKALNMKVTGTFKPCEDCLIGKAKWANVNKAPATRAVVPGERISINISSSKRLPHIIKRFFYYFKKCAQHGTICSWRGLFTKRFNRIE